MTRAIPTRLWLAAALAAATPLAPAWANEAPPVEAAPAIAPMRLPLMPPALVEQAARELLGIRYRFGGNDPARGVDCSGLVQLVWQKLGLPELPRTSAAMAAQGEPIATDALRPGDLVFFNTRGRRYSHVGIYLGEGRFIHASSVLRRVTESALDERYYRQRFNGARRVLSDTPDRPVTAEGSERP